jgi:FkbM family methyltransferase
MLCETRSSICVNLALWPTSGGTVQFVDAHGLSCISQFQHLDSNAKSRDGFTRRTIEIDTINPTHLMDRFEAPTEIEYLSLDVEGAEYDILTGIDFGRYNILLMTVENDCSPERQARVRQYLAQFGYVGLQLSYDDFFFKPDHEYPVSPAVVAHALGCRDENLRPFVPDAAMRS